MAPDHSPSNRAFSTFKTVAEGQPNISSTGERTLEALRGRGIDGTSVNDLAFELNLLPKHVGTVLTRQLEPIGEAFKAGKRWIATDAVLSLKSPKLTLERLKNELERALFNGGGPPEQIKDFLEEYRGARDLKLSPEEAFHFAQQRLSKSQPIGATT